MRRRELLLGAGGVATGALGALAGCSATDGALGGGPPGFTDWLPAPAALSADPYPCYRLDVQALLSADAVKQSTTDEVRALLSGRAPSWSRPTRSTGSSASGRGRPGSSGSSSSGRSTSGR